MEEEESEKEEQKNSLFFSLKKILSLFSRISKKKLFL